jgi:NADH:ubiquinone oxidoreductase subunit 3 (subunit A)
MQANANTPYVFVVIAGMVSLLFPGVLFLVSKFQRKTGVRSGRFSEAPTANTGVHATPLLSEVRAQRFNSRYFVALNLGAVLMIYALSMIPIAASVRQQLMVQKTEGEFLKLCLAVLGLPLAMIISVFYATRKNDLSWDLKWLRKSDPRESKNGKTEGST